MKRCTCLLADYPHPYESPPCPCGGYVEAVSGSLKNGQPAVPVVVELRNLTGNEIQIPYSWEEDLMVRLAPYSVHRVPPAVWKAMNQRSGPAIIEALRSHGLAAAELSADEVGL